MQRLPLLPRPGEQGMGWAVLLSPAWGAGVYGSCQDTRGGGGGRAPAQLTSVQRSV